MGLISWHNKAVMLFIVATLLFALHVDAQLQSQSRIDSLVNILAKEKEDTAKVMILNAIAYEYPYINPDEGIKYGQQSLTLATKLDWQPGIAKANYAIGGNYETKSDYPNALLYEYKALKIHEMMHDEPNQALMLGNIGIIYHTQGDQDKAMEYDSLSLMMYERLNDKKGMARILSNIANVYSSRHNYPKTLEYNLHALSLIETLGDKQLLATNLGNMGNVYADQGDFAKAMVYYFKALRMEDAIGNISGVARNMGNIGETYLDISKDSTYATKSDSLIPAGPAANLNKAIDYLSRSIVLSKEIKHPDYLLAFSESLTEAYSMSGHFENALRTYRDFIQVRDSVYNLKKNSDFARLQLNYEYGKREEELKYQKAESTVYLYRGYWDTVDNTSFHLPKFHAAEKIKCAANARKEAQ